MGMPIIRFVGCCTIVVVVVVVVVVVIVQCRQTKEQGRINVHPDIIANGGIGRCKYSPFVARRSIVVPFVVVGGSWFDDKIE